MPRDFQSQTAIGGEDSSYRSRDYCKFSQRVPKVPCVRVRINLTRARRSTGQTTALRRQISTGSNPVERIIYQSTRTRKQILGVNFMSPYHRFSHAEQGTYPLVRPRFHPPPSWDRGRDVDLGVSSSPAATGNPPPKSCRWRDSQEERRGSAKPVTGGSNPPLASIPRCSQVGKAPGSYPGYSVVQVYSPRLSIQSRSRLAQLVRAFDC